MKDVQYQQQLESRLGMDRNGERTISPVKRKHRNIEFTGRFWEQKRNFKNPTEKTSQFYTSCLVHFKSSTDDLHLFQGDESISLCNY